MVINLIFQAMQPAQVILQSKGKQTSTKATSLVSEPDVFDESKFKDVPSHVKDTIKRDIPDDAFLQMDVLYREQYAIALMARLFQLLSKQKGLFNEEMVNGFVVAGKTESKIYGRFVPECEKLGSVCVVIVEMFKLGHFIFINVGVAQMNRYWELFEITFHGGLVKGHQNIQYFHNTVVFVTTVFEKGTNSYHKQFKNIKTC